MLNPSYTNPLNGLTFEQIKAQNLPRNMIVIANDYKTPTADRVHWHRPSARTELCASNGLCPFDGFNEPRARSINFFEDPVTHLPKDPRIFGRPNPQFVNITGYETSAGSDYDGWQFGFPGTQLRARVDEVAALGQLHVVVDLQRSREQPLRRRDQSVQSRRRVVVLGQRSAASLHLEQCEPPAVGHAGGGDCLRRIAAPHQYPHQPRSVRDGATGRWLDATGRTIARNSERTPENDYKLDLRFSKTVAIGRVRLQGILEAFNILNTENLTGYNGLYGSNTHCSQRVSSRSSISRASCSLVSV